MQRCQCAADLVIKIQPLQLFRFNEHRALSFRQTDTRSRKIRYAVCGFGWAAREYSDETLSCNSFPISQ